MWCNHKNVAGLGVKSFECIECGARSHDNGQSWHGGRKYDTNRIYEHSSYR